MVVIFGHCCTGDPPTVVILLIITGETDLLLDVLVGPAPHGKGIGKQYKPSIKSKEYRLGCFQHKVQGVPIKPVLTHLDALKYELQIKGNFQTNEHRNYVFFSQK